MADAPDSRQSDSNATPAALPAHGSNQHARATTPGHDGGSSNHVSQQAVEQDMLRATNPGLLHAAARLGAVGLLRSLILNRGLDPNQINDEGWPPLHVALAECGGNDCHHQERAVLTLITEVPTVDVNLRRPDGMTPLMVAAAGGMVDILRALVARGADVEATIFDIPSTTALELAASAEKEEAALYLLEEAGAPWAVGPWNALHAAVRHGLVRLLRSVLRRMRTDGIDDATMIAAQLPMASLHAITARAGTSEASLQILIEEGLDVKRPITLGRPTADGLLASTTLLHMACKVGNLEAAAFLIRQGCHASERDSEGRMPHHLAAQHGHLPLLRFLLSNFPAIDVDEESIDITGRFTALHYAALGGWVDVVEWLLSAGADPRRTCKGRIGDDKRSLNAFDMASMQGRTAVVTVLREHREEVEAAARVAQTLAEQRNNRMLLAGVASEQPPVDSEARTSLGSTEHASGIMPNTSNERPPPLREFLQMHAPPSLMCPISLRLLEDPVLLMADGCTYSRASIERHFAARCEGGQPLTSPLTNADIIDPALAVLAPNVLVRGQVLEYRQTTTRKWEQAELRWRE